MFFLPAARNAIKSTSIEQLEVSPCTNQALVTYKNGNQYLYSNIDEDAMFDVLFHNVKSFGKWVNQYCKADGVAVFPIAAWLLSLIKQHIHTTMIAPTLSRFEEAVSTIIESDSVADIEQFMEELTSYGVIEISQLEEAYAGCYRNEATFCEDLMSDIYSSEMDALPTWLQYAIDWELVWHQSLRHDYFTVYFDSEYYFFNSNF